jgi:DnaA family protein
MPISTGKPPIKTAQIALPLAFDRQYSFANYFSDKGDFYGASLSALIRGQGESMIGLWGSCDSGKTHLINASAHFARQQDVGFQLYDATDLLDSDPLAFDDFAGGGLLIIDNLDLVCGHIGWEQRFYQVINHCNIGQLNFIFTTTANPLKLNCKLADFKSRLAWALLMQLPAAEDAVLGEIIRFRASLLGLDFTREVIAYLLTHYSRQLSAQIEILRILDSASLSTQKRITVPMIKQTLADRLA